MPQTTYPPARRMLGAVSADARILRAMSVDVAHAADPRHLARRSAAADPFELRDPEYIARTLPALRAMADVWLAQRAECSPHLDGEELRLLPGGEVAAPVDLVEVREVRVDRLDPAARGSPDLAGERREADRNRDRRRSLAGRTGYGLGPSKFPVPPGGRGAGARQPVPRRPARRVDPASQLSEFPFGISTWKGRMSIAVSAAVPMTTSVLEGGRRRPPLRPKGGEIGARFDPLTYLNSRSSFLHYFFTRKTQFTVKEARTRTRPRGRSQHPLRPVRAAQAGVRGVMEEVARPVLGYGGWFPPLSVKAHKARPAPAFELGS
jgi:hypothetical protein